MNDSPSKLSMAGYRRRPDGTWARTIKFEARSPSGGGTWSTDVLVRTSSGRLLRVERTYAARSALARWAAVKR